MNNKLEQLYNGLEDSRRALLNELAAYDTAKLETQPSPGKWSVAQIVYHLNKAESLSISYVSKKMLDVKNLKNTGMVESFKVGLLWMLFESPLKFKVPTNVLGDMPEKVDYDTAVKQWNVTRDNLKQLLESIPEDMLRKNVFKQPAIGRINVYQMVDFMQTHFNRHRRQVNMIIDPIIRISSTPKSFK